MTMRTGLGGAPFQKVLASKFEDILARITMICYNFLEQLSSTCTSLHLSCYQLYHNCVIPMVCLISSPSFLASTAHLMNIRVAPILQNRGDLPVFPNGLSDEKLQTMISLISCWHKANEWFSRLANMCDRLCSLQSAARSTLFPQLAWCIKN